MTKYSLSLLIAAFCFFKATQAYDEYADLVPNGRKLGIAAIGHTSPNGGGARNAFGSDFAAAEYTWDKAFCEKDSDNDGVSNGKELGDPCCLWSKAKPTELFTTGLSLPGDPKSTTTNQNILNFDCSSLANSDGGSGNSNSSSTTDNDKASASSQWINASFIYSVLIACTLAFTMNFAI